MSRSSSRRTTRQRMLDQGYIGNCYAASEALYHILGGKNAGWTPMFLGGKYRTKHGGHWFLKHKTGVIVDPAVRQFSDSYSIRTSDYENARGCGFLTKSPSKEAQKVIQTLTWRKRK